MLNGSEMEVLNIRHEESPVGSDDYYHDCYVTFLDGETYRYDASDITVLH